MKTSPLDHITDAELLDRYYADGKTEWIGALLERYTLLLLGVCMKYLKDEEEARDCVQQVFLKVLTELPKYRVDYFKSWLYMVAKNHCLMKLRGQQGRQVRTVTDGMAIAAPDDRQALLEHEDTYDVLEESLAELNEEQRQCINLFYLQKHSYQQISEQTGYTPMQVKSYIQNGKRNLRLLMERKLKEKKATGK